MSIFKTVTSFFVEEAGPDAGTLGEETGKPRSTILVIDDDAEFLKTMRVLLSGAGYGVLTANTGSKGLNMLRYASHDVVAVLLDYNMPRFNGAITLEHLRRLNGKVKVIGISGVNPAEIPDRFQKRLDRFLAKPFANADLLRTIETVLGGCSPAQPAASTPA